MFVIFGSRMLMLVQIETAEPPVYMLDTRNELKAPFSDVDWIFFNNLTLVCAHQVFWKSILNILTDLERDTQSFSHLKSNKLITDCRHYSKTFELYQPCKSLKNHLQLQIFSIRKYLKIFCIYLKSEIYEIHFSFVWFLNDWIHS